MKIQGKTNTNIQVGILDSEVGISWFDFGDVRHVDAAREYARRIMGQHEQEIEVQTRDESRPDVLYSHTVTREVTYKVVAHRGDDDE